SVACALARLPICTVSRNGGWFPWLACLKLAISLSLICCVRLPISSSRRSASAWVAVSNSLGVGYCSAAPVCAHAACTALCVVSDMTLPLVVGVEAEQVGLI